MAASVSYDISVVIPAYNEEQHIRTTVQRINDFLALYSRSFEIIVIDDGSRDRTLEEVCLAKVDQRRITVLKNEKNLGKGASVKRGVLAAQYDWVLFSDADLSTPIEELEKFFPLMKQKVDVIIGSRALVQSHIIKKQNIIRRNMGRIFNFLVQLLLIRGITDTQCGFKCFKREAAQKLFCLQRLARFSFDVEILYLAKLFQFRIEQVPIAWINRPQSRVNVVSDSLNMLADLFRIRWNSLRGIYEIKS
jgi:dolichyl-phosphate beta-glucosyltransferase